MVTSMLFPFGHLALTINIMVYVTANSQRLKPEKSLKWAIFLFFLEKSCVCQTFVVPLQRIYFTIRTFEIKQSLIFNI